MKGFVITLISVAFLNGAVGMVSPEGDIKKYVRLAGALCILAANAKWDDENRFDSVLTDYLTHITDDKPITARQCIKALAQLGAAKPSYIARILPALREADLSKYKDSMRALIKKDIEETENILLKYI